MICSREDLEKTYRLLLGGRITYTSELEAISSISVQDLAIRTMCAYMISCCSERRKPFFYKLTVPSESDQAVGRMCSHCKEMVLDDAFPTFSTLNQKVYVATSVYITGCGAMDCKGKVYLIPSDKWQLYVLCTRKFLTALPNVGRRGDASAFLCRSEDELGDCLPKSVEVECQACHHRVWYGRPRWTIEKDARLVVPRQNCCNCQKRSQFFAPVDQWATIANPALFKLWGAVTKRINTDASVYLPLRSALIGKSDLQWIKDQMLQFRLNENAEVVSSSTEPV